MTSDWCFKMVPDDDGDPIYYVYLGEEISPRYIVQTYDDAPIEPILEGLKLHTVSRDKSFIDAMQDQRFDIIFEPAATPPKPAPRTRRK